jgi:hypothetical protein
MDLVHDAICTVPKGGALIMRPLLLHASSACAIPKSRRVIHLEFASAELPQGLDWNDKVSKPWKPLTSGGSVASRIVQRTNAIMGS